MTVTFIFQKLKHRWVLQGQAECPEGFLPQERLCSGERLILKSVEVIASPGQAPLKVGTPIHVQSTGRFFCTSCAKLARKLFSGYCGECLTTKAEADACVLSPDRCHYLSGTCREPQWGRQFCYQPHLVYLSYTGDFKVGITRATQVPTRWFDQGATFAVALAKVGSRHQAGKIEKVLAQHFSDRTHWQRMLNAHNTLPSDEAVEQVLSRVKTMRSDLASLDSLHVRVSAPPLAPDAGVIEWFEKPSFFQIEFSQSALPQNIASLSLAKQAEISGQLLGIKGQYLILDSGVFNVRRHEGFEANWKGAQN